LEIFGKNPSYIKPFFIAAPVRPTTPPPTPGKKISLIHPKNRLVIQESTTRGLWIKNAVEVAIESPADVLNLMAQGNLSRMVAATSTFLSFFLFLFFLTSFFSSLFFFFLFFFPIFFFPIALSSSSFNQILSIFLFHSTKQRKLTKSRDFHCNNTKDRYG
jgi:hypothetical protein